MFIHEFRYFLLRQLRNRTELFWAMVFPMILGTLFFFAFSNITDSTETLRTIPIAYVPGEGSLSDDFEQLLDDLSRSYDSTPLVSLRSFTKDEAIAALDAGKITGFYSIKNDKVILTIAPASNALQSSILESIQQSFNVQYKAISQLSQSHPEKVQDAIAALSEGTQDSYLKNVTLSNGNMDMTTQYFFNLIAMACLFTSFTGANIALKNQANLSMIGARKQVSPTRHIVRILSEFCACGVISFATMGVTITYILYVLKIDFGTQVSLIYFTGFVGSLLGISFGFFIGSLGHMSEGTKIGMLISISMVCSFLSGLMVDSMKMIIEKNLPIINRINPAALISDCFYTLSIYTQLDRYWHDILGLVVITLLFLFGGFLVVRRETYASL